MQFQRNPASSRPVNWLWLPWRTHVCRSISCTRLSTRFLPLWNIPSACSRLHPLVLASLESLSFLTAIPSHTLSRSRLVTHAYTLFLSHSHPLLLLHSWSLCHDNKMCRGTISICILLVQSSYHVQMPCAATLYPSIYIVFRFFKFYPCSPA